MTTRECGRCENPHQVYGRRRDRDFARRLFKDIVFYRDFLRIEGPERSPLGYHFGRRIAGFTPKLHAFTGRYGLLYAQDEQMNR